MEKRESAARRNSTGPADSERFSADWGIGKVDLSRSIMEDACDGEGDRNDTTEMDEISRNDQD